MAGPVFCVIDAVCPVKVLLKQMACAKEKDGHVCEVEVHVCRQHCASGMIQSTLKYALRRMQDGAEPELAAQPQVYIQANMLSIKHPEKHIFLCCTTSNMFVGAALPPKK